MPQDDLEGQIRATFNAVVVGPDDKLLITVPQTFVMKPDGGRDGRQRFADAVSSVFGPRVLIVWGDIDVAVVKGDGS